MKKWLILILILLISGCTQAVDSTPEEECFETVFYSEWTDCADGLQNRTKYTFNCTTYENIETIEEQECLPDCIPDWVCTEWTNCLSAGYKTRTCSDQNACSSTLEIPSTREDCSFSNPCDDITDAEMKSTCKSILFDDYTYCNNAGETTNIQDCIFDYAPVRNDLTSCDLINDSLSRNTCKAKVTTDSSYCNILAPEYRDDCNLALDLYLKELAGDELDSSYCYLISDTDVKSDCLADNNYNYYSTWKDNINDCADLDYQSSILLYQTSRACYVYHITQLQSQNTCNLVPSWMDNDCNTITQFNISYCYDQSGIQRDWCLANIAYYNSDISYCREATSEDNCIYTLGYWFKEKDYCLLIEDETLRNYCLSSYVTYCQSNYYNCEPYNYCEQVIDDATRKNTCIYNLVKDSIIIDNRQW